jgi:hypothetical protein
MITLSFGAKGSVQFCPVAEWEQARPWAEARGGKHLQRLFSRCLCADVVDLMAELAAASGTAPPWEGIFFTGLLNAIPIDATEIGVSVT